jgi:hypothetical protein
MTDWRSGLDLFRSTPAKADRLQRVRTSSLRWRVARWSVPTRRRYSQAPKS